MPLAMGGRQGSISWLRHEGPAQTVAPIRFGTARHFDQRRPGKCLSWRCSTPRERGIWRLVHLSGSRCPDSFKRRTAQADMVGRLRRSAARPFAGREHSAAAPGSVRWRSVRPIGGRACSHRSTSRWVRPLCRLRRSRRVAHRTETAQRRDALLRRTPPGRQRGAYRERKAASRANAEPNSVALTLRTCSRSGCRNPLPTNHKRRLYCSEKCKVRAHQARLKRARTIADTPTDTPTPTDSRERPERENDKTLGPRGIRTTTNATEPQRIGLWIR